MVALALLARTGVAVDPPPIAGDSRRRCCWQPARRHAGTSNSPTRCEPLGRPIRMPQGKGCAGRASNGSGHRRDGGMAYQRSSCATQRKLLARDQWRVCGGRRAKVPSRDRRIRACTANSRHRRDPKPSVCGTRPLSHDGPFGPWLTRITPPAWHSVATTFRNDRSVIFDLFNEPYGGSWSCWRDGCLIKHSIAGKEVTYRAAGMQSLVDAVRSADAPQVLMLRRLITQVMIVIGSNMHRMIPTTSWPRASIRTTSRPAILRRAGRQHWRRSRSMFRSSRVN